MTDKIVPLVVGGVSLAGCVILLLKMIRLPAQDAIFADKEAGNHISTPYGLWATLAWFAGLIAATWLMGFILALLVFLIMFFRLRAGASWYKTLLLTTCGIAFMCFMAGVLHRDFPPGLLQQAFDLPWPLR